MLEFAFAASLASDVVTAVGVFCPGDVILADAAAAVSMVRLGFGWNALLLLPPLCGPRANVGVPAEGGAEVRPGGIGITGVVVPLARPVATSMRLPSSPISVGEDAALRAGVSALAACDFWVGVGVRERETLPVIAGVSEGAFEGASEVASDGGSDAAPLSSAAVGTVPVLNASLAPSGGEFALDDGELTRLASPGPSTTSSVVKTAEVALAPLPVLVMALFSTTPPNQPNEPVVDPKPVGELGAEEAGGGSACV